MKSNKFKNEQPNYSKITEYYSTYIPYRPELRKYVGSVNSTLLINQLERWFAYKPDIFYKFLSPCEHLNYRTNDSWVEELGFTEAEFRHAFDAIGTRYRSKGHLLEVLNANGDPFQEKYYLSYIDIKKGLTFYLRNDEAVNRLFNNIIAAQQPTSLSIAEEEGDPLNAEEINRMVDRVKMLISRDCENRSQKSLTPGIKMPSSGTKDCVTLEIKKPSSETEDSLALELEKPSSRPEETLSPYKEQEIQQEITTKKTAAENSVVNSAVIAEKNSPLAADFNYSKNANGNATLKTPNAHSVQNQLHKHEFQHPESSMYHAHPHDDKKKQDVVELTKKLEISAQTNSQLAAAQFKKNDFAIGTELTTSQTLLIECFVESHYDSFLKHTASKEVWLAAIKADILNPNTFIKTAGNFDHKFNTIKRLIKQNKWLPQSCLQSTKTQVTEQEHKIKSLQNQIQCLELEKDGVMLDLKNWEPNSAIAQCRLRSIAACDEALKPLLAELSAIKQAFNPDATDRASARLTVGSI